MKPEIVVGLIAPVGCNRTLVKEAITTFLRGCDYNCHDIRLSQSMGKFPTHSLPASETEKERIDAFMDLGNSLRNHHGADVLSRLAIHEIREIRKSAGKKATEPNYDNAYLIDSLKHPSEIELLREVYKDHFVCISVYESKSQRIRNLQRIMQVSAGVEMAGKYDEDAVHLIERDEKEPDLRHGQSVRDAFPLSDFFVDGSVGRDLRGQLRRFFELLFGKPFVTPTIDEYGMFQAQAAALRSADLSRQVGVSIFNQHGEHLVSGCNEVPKPGGGAFWSDMSDSDSGDNRDFRRGNDSSAAMKNTLIVEVIDALGADWIQEEKGKLSEREKLEELLYRPGANLKSKRIASILEFGRVVHAEMHAISEAARRGVSIRNSVLYTTTFPCHMCARHIIASGISKVVFIEPYPKSLAKQLHSESIDIDEDSDALPDAVKFKTFVGVSPRKYFELFSKGERKDAVGTAISWTAKDAIPRVSSTIGYILNESEKVISLETVFREEST